MQRRHLLSTAAAALAAPTLLRAQALERPRLTLAVGGKNLLYYLPLTIAETQGYFKEDLGLEDVRDNWDTITDRDGFGVPNGLPEETAMFLPFFK